MRKDGEVDTANDIDEHLNTSPQVQNCLQNEQIVSKELYETLRNRFTVNYMKYKNLTEMEWTELTNVRKKLSNEELDGIDIIAFEFLNDIKNEMCIVTYENINCLIYTSAVTLKQHLNTVFLKVDQNNEKVKEPQWMNHQ